MTTRRNFRLRSHKRAPVSIPLMIIRDGKAFEGHMRELSRGGALIESDEDINPAEPLLIGFRIKAIPEVIEIPCDVIYKRSPSDDSRIQRKWGYGIRFGEISPELGTRIDAWVKNERLFGDLAAALSEARSRRGRDE